MKDENDVKLEREHNRLKFFPIMMYAIVMGLGGLTITYQKAHIWLGFPSIIGTVLMYLTTIAFGVISVIYMMKCFKYKQAVISEFNHPIRINFFAAISIIIDVSYHLQEEFVSLSALFWYVGVVLHFVLTMYTISFWINKNQVLDHSNPAWFIPIVGNVLVPVGGVGFANAGVLNYF